MFLAKPFVAGEGQSRSMWNLARLAEIMCDRNVGFFAYDDFTMGLPTGKYTVTQATSGTFALGDADGGIAIIDAGASTDTQGANVQLGGTAGEIVKAEDNTEIWFETRLTPKTIGTDGAGLQFFAGLSETDTSIIASSANTSDNHIGFEAIATDDMTFVSEKATARGTVSSAGTLVAGTAIHLGFHVIGTDTVEVYVDGVKDASTIATANIPVLEMRPSWVCQADGGGTQPTVEVDWWYLVKSFRIG